MKHVLSCLAIAVAVLSGFGETNLIDIPWNQPVVRPEDATNSSTVLGSINSNLTSTVGKVGVYQNNTQAVAIGAGVSIDEDARGGIGINGYTAWPSYLDGVFSIALGIDNRVGYGDYGTPTETNSVPHYSIAIGTSNRAAYRHSYAIGSQANALHERTAAIGYGLTAEHQGSTVIGQGIRPSTTNDTEDLDINNGGRESWKYGKSHGTGTFNIVAVGNGSKDPGMSGVYINDKSLAELTGIRNGETVVKTQYVNGVWTTPVTCATDYTITIGNNAKATETATSSQSIAIGRDALANGSATVAVGPNAFAESTMAIALGWRANAVGQQSISIGAAGKSNQNYWNTDGTINTNSDLALASGLRAINIGYDGKATGDRSTTIGAFAKATASDAVQIGVGTNTEAKTLKFMDVTIVRDGKVVAEDLSYLDPKVIDPTDSVNSYDEIEFTVNPHETLTLLPTNSAFGVGTELYVTCTQTNKRNYTIFMPNEPALCAGFPITFATEFEDTKIKAVYEGNKCQAYKLPAKFTVTQPYSKLVVFKIEEYDDGTDWDPVITACNIKGNSDYTNPKFTVDGANALIGTNLHAGVEFKIAYPAYDDSDNEIVRTNVVDNVGSDGILSGTFYTNVVKFTDISPTKLRLTNVTTRATWVDVIYKTKNGEAPVLRKDITFTE